MTECCTMTIKQELRDPLELSDCDLRFRDFHRCHRCHYRTKSDILLKRHLKRHYKPVVSFDCTHPIPPYKCDKCRFQTHLIHNFFRHSCNQIEIVPYEALKLCCSHCSFCTHSYLILLKHMDTCDEEQKKRANDFNLNQQEYFQCYQFLTQIQCFQIEWLKCEKCPYMSRMLGNLRKHSEAVHSVSSKVKWFQCEPCLFNVEQIFYLRKHVLMEHGQDVPGMDYDSA